MSSQNLDSSLIAEEMTTLESHLLELKHNVTKIEGFLGGTEDEYESYIKQFIENEGLLTNEFSSLFKEQLDELQFNKLEEKLASFHVLVGTSKDGWSEPLWEYYHSHQNTESSERFDRYGEDGKPLSSTAIIEHKMKQLQNFANAEASKHRSENKSSMNSEMSAAISPDRIMRSSFGQSLIEIDERERMYSRKQKEKETTSNQCCCRIF